MPIAVTATDALHNRRENQFPQGIAKSFFRRLYIGSEPANGGTLEREKAHLPQAYLVEQPADSTVAPHFHDTNQFQLFVHGHGRFGKISVDGLMVHYAGAHTPYGPIVAEADGVHYLTLRNSWDSGAKIMPKSRAMLRKVKRVHRMATDFAAAPAQCLLSCDVSERDLIGLEDDGLGVRQYDIGAGQSCQLGFALAGAGAYAFVLAGDIIYEGDLLETQSLIHRAANEGALDVVAGDAGATVIFLQFPPEPPELEEAN